MYDHTLYLRTLADFSAMLLAPYEVEVVFDELADRVTDALGLAGSGVSLAREDRLEFHTAYGDAVAAVERAQEELQQGPCVTAFLSGRVVAVDDLPHEQRRWPQYCQMAAAVDITAVASIPMKLDDQIVGVLDLYGRGHREWAEDDLTAAMVMANMATVFLINASHHRKQVELNEQLHRALESRINIEQAKGALSARHDITPDEGFQRLRSYARNHNLTVRDVAEAIVEHGLAV